MNQNDKVLSCLGLIIVTVLTLIANALMNGFVLKTLWMWFVASTFNLPAITIAQALGISLIVQFYLYAVKKEESTITSTGDALPKLFGAFVEVLVKSAFFLGLGYIVLQFI